MEEAGSLESQALIAACIDMYMLLQELQEDTSCLSMSDLKLGELFRHIVAEHRHLDCLSISDQHYGSHGIISAAGPSEQGKHRVLEKSLKPLTRSMAHNRQHNNSSNDTDPVCDFAQKRHCL